MTQSSRLETRPAPPATSAPDSAELGAFDYSGEAELFASPARRGQALGYRRFARAADAIRFAVEELSPRTLLGTLLQVGDRRVGGGEIRRLYDSDAYPLVRSPRAQ